MQHRQIYILIFLAACLTACAAGPNTAEQTANAASQIAGFWLGLWHGMIAPITFLVSLFVDTVHMYEVHNNGGWYNFGFVLGSGLLFGGSSSASKRRRD